MTINPASPVVGQSDVMAMVNDLQQQVTSLSRILQFYLNVGGDLSGSLPDPEVETMMGVTLFNGAGKSVWLQGGALSPPVITTPTRVLNTVYIPSANHATLVVAGVLLTLPNAASQAFCEPIIEGVAQAAVNISITSAPGYSISENGTMTFLVPATDSYEFATFTSGGGTVTDLNVTEYQL